MENLKNKLMECIMSDDNYKAEYEENKLFSQIIDGIVESNDPIDSIINALYSYNQMLTTVVGAIAVNMDEKTVQDSIKMFEDTLEENNE